MSLPTTHAPARKAVLLLSGGLDSATVGAIARAEGYELHALTFRYGQRHEIEAEVARRVGAMLGVASQVDVAIDLRVFGGSALTADIAVPKDRDDAAMGAGIPITYVPARNTIFLSFALAQAEVLGARDIFIGVNAVDYSGYPDCRPEFIAAFQQMARLATRIGVEDAQAETADARPEHELTIHAPLIHLTKAEIIQRGAALGVDYALTLSCYDPTPAGLACGHCDACLLRRRGFEQAALPDPTRYA